MTADQAKVALQFLARVELKGMEADAFLDACRALAAIANPKPVVKED